VDVMAMYSELLDAALHERCVGASTMTVTDSVSALVHCRTPLESPGLPADGTATALANQFAYDVALIELARCVGLDCDPSTFDRPERRRTELRRELISRGIRLGKVDHSTSGGG